MKIENIFENEYKIPLSVIILLLIIAILLGFYQLKIEIFVTLSISVITSLLATFIYNRVVINYENTKLKKLRSLSNEDFLLKMLYSLEKLRKIYLENWKVSITLNNFKENNKIDDLFYQCNIRYNYQKYIKPNKIEMIFYRILEDKNDDELQKNIDFINEFEFHWYMDERKFKKEIDDSYYSIKNLIINNQNIKLDKEINGNKIIYSANIENHDKEYIDIEYEVQLPLEKEDIMLVNVDFPTKNAKIEFDYSHLANKIEIYGLESISFTDKPLMYDSENRLIFTYNDWLMPKNSFIFSWWEKK